MKNYTFIIEQEDGSTKSTHDINEAIRYLVDLKNKENIKRDSYENAHKEKEDA